MESSRLSNSEITETFNDHLYEFLTDIYKLFPNNGDIQSAKNSVMAFRTISSSRLIKNWKEDINAIYSKEIYAGDLNFFVNKDYSEELKQFPDGDSALDKIECLREPIKTMSDDNKNKTILYLQNLTRLAELYGK
jgi:hypothetical protein